MELSKTIKKLRTEKGWSQETLAEKAYVSRQTVSNWETEKSFPDIHSLLLLSGLFGVSLDNLVKGDVETMKQTVQNEDAKRISRYPYLAVAEILALILILPPVIEHCGELGALIGGILAGVMATALFLTFQHYFSLLQKNDIQTTRELLAYLNGETLDEIEQAAEQKKRNALRKFQIATAVISGGSLLFAVIYGVILFIK
ncbi:MAG: helix-turn-helix transcriptional regulator [Oscillospiraceae bacterium]|nr:helix-turn-helix transcriptional regulator [Oscillospiraceae bacterium]